MAWNGSGTFTRTNGTFSGATVWAQDAALPVDMEATRFDTHDQDLAQGINACLAKNGENAMTGALNLGGFGLSNAATLRATSAVDVTLASTTHAFQAGTSALPNVSIGDTQIESRNNGAAATLYAQTLGKRLQLGSVNAVDASASGEQSLVIANGIGVLSIDRYSADTSSPILELRKSRSGTVGSHGLTLVNDYIGAIRFIGDTGSAFNLGGYIQVVHNATTGASDLPTQMTFGVTPDGSATARHAFNISEDSVINYAGSTVGLYQIYNNTGATRFMYIQAQSAGVSVAADQASSTVNLVSKNAGGTAYATVVANGDNAYLAYQGSGAVATQDRAANGKAAGAQVTDGTGSLRDIGFNVLPYNQQDATYTIARADCGYILTHGSGSAHTWTLPASSDTTMPETACIMCLNAGAGVVTLAPGSGVTLTWLSGVSASNGSRTLAQGGIATLWRLSASQWYVWGTGLA